MNSFPSGTIASEGKIIDPIEGRRSPVLICKLDNSTPSVFTADTNFTGPLFPGEELPSYGFNASSTPKAQNNLFRSIN